MRINKLYIVIGLILAFGIFFELAAHADETNQKTTITFSAPVRIPGQVLPAGGYVFTVDPDDQNIVTIAGADSNVIYATLLTASTLDLNPANDTTVTLAEEGAGQNAVLVKWVYPGNTAGHQFIYPQQQEQELTSAAQETFVGNRPLPTATYGGGN